jgi:uncharacterized membrane protein YheB (UPF0754 family)
VNPELINVVLSIVVAAVAGGLTNAVAVWMLFHPYEPPRWFGRPITFLQGAIPKNKARLATAIGKTVGTKLLTPEDLARSLTEPGFREAFDERLAVFIRALLDRQRGTLRELLPAALGNELRTILDQVSASMLVRLDAYLQTEEFRNVARQWAESIAAELEHKQLGDDFLTPAREEALAATVNGWLEELVESPGFSTAIRDYLDRGAERLLVPGRTFQEILPIGMVAAFERAIAGYLPIAIEKLAGVLDDPSARSRVERIVHELLDRFMADLRFHQRLVAALLITPETVDRVLRAIEKEGASKIAELLQDPEIRDAIARGVNNAVVDFLAKPVTSVLGLPGDPSVIAAQDTIAGWLQGLARDPQTRRFATDRLLAALHSAEDRTWGDVFRHIPPERMADALVQLARSARAREVYAEVADRVFDAALNHPLGRLASHLPDNAPQRIEQLLSEPLWLWIQEQIPPIAQRVNVGKKVEQRILEFPTSMLEDIIRRVTERELRLIVQLGWVLGAIIGIFSALVNTLL